MSNRLKIIAAFAVIYLVWGSTFLGVRIAVQSMPPLGMAAIRFAISGLILLALGGMGGERPTLRHWRNAAIAGALFFFGNHSLIGAASRVLPSSVVCLIIATEVPIIAVLSAIFMPDGKLTWRVVIGSALGLAGVASLFMSPDDRLPVAPSLMVLGAATAWSIGALVSRRLDGPKDLMLRSGMQMTTGGVMLTLGSLFGGETFSPQATSARSIGVLAYLIVFGSVIAFACYSWLLERVPTEAVATHVFVNPLVATVLGAWVGGEELRLAQLRAGVLILASVFAIMYRPRGSALDVDAGAGRLHARDEAGDRVV